MKLLRYDEARRQLALATRVDEVKKIRDKAVAVAAYATQAKDSEMLSMATDLRIRAEVKAGELLIDMKEAGERQGRSQPKKLKSHDGTLIPKLKDLGINKNQSHRWQALARLPAGKLAATIAHRIRIVVAAASDHVEVVKAARAERHKVKAAKREQRMSELANAINDLPQKEFAVIYVDPEWRWKPWSDAGLDGSSADNHYPTSELEAIKRRDVRSIAADNCVMFMCATVPMLPQAIEVMEAWGFKYVSHFVWVKDKTGMGYWNRNQHELLLVGTRGNIPAPLEGTQWPSVIFAPRGKHSEKPDKFYELIEHYYPGLPKVELNARRARAGWDSWGNEAPKAEAAE